MFFFFFWFFLEMRWAETWSRGSSTVVCSSIMCPTWCELKLVCAWWKVGKLEVLTRPFVSPIIVDLSVSIFKLKRIAHASFLVHACQQNIFFFCSIMLYKLYKITFPSLLMERFACSIGFSKPNCIKYLRMILCILRELQR